MISAGNYEGKAVKGGVQFGDTNAGNLQIAINMELFDAQNNSVGEMTTFLYFTEGAQVYAYERLRLLGWKGTGPDDIDKLDDIFTNKVPCRVTAPEAYTAEDGSKKMGQSKLEIITGGTVTLSKPVDMGTFKSRLKALGGTTPSTGSGGGTAGGPKPPF
jgi:hypothetical protein